MQTVSGEKADLGEKTDNQLKTYFSSIGCRVGNVENTLTGTL